MTFLLCLVSVLLAPATTSRPATAPSPATTKTATTQFADWKQVVLDRAGIDAWPTVTRIKFTFNVESEGQTVSRSHDWDLATGIDRITFNGNTVAVNVREFDPNDPATADSADAQAFAIWTNDSYWLLMPLKLSDPGVNFGAVALTRDLPPSRATVTMSFDDVGLTSGDEYDLSIDLRRGVVDAWTFRPNAETSVTWTWQDYEDFNGLYLSTNHVPEGEGDTPRIFFTGIEVQRGQ